MARRRRRSRKHSRKMGLGRLIFPVAAGASFLSQLTSKDFGAGGVGTTTFATANASGKAQFLVNDIVGRITGINPFAQSVQFKQTINPAGVLNKWTGAGLALMLLGSIPGMPLKGKAKSIGKGLLVGGAVGGFFDDPNPNTTMGWGMKSYGTNMAAGYQGGQGTGVPFATND